MDGTACLTDCPLTVIAFRNLKKDFVSARGAIFHHVVEAVSEWGSGIPLLYGSYVNQDEPSNNDRTLPGKGTDFVPVLSTHTIFALPFAHTVPSFVSSRIV